MKKMLNIIFIIGIIFTIIGWFFDKATSFDWLMIKIAPDYVFAQKALSDLKENPKIALTRQHKGFKILLDKWPNLEGKDSVEYIGRTVAFVSFGSQIKNDIELVLYDKGQKEIKKRWNISEAESVLEKMIETRLFKIGAFLFWGGIIVSIISHIVSIKTIS